MNEQINTEGVVRVGELDTRVMREARVAEDHRNSLISGSVKAYRETDAFVESLQRSAGPYDDTRTMATIRTWLGDRIREVQSPATMEDTDV
jgi:hypothetical protein